VEYPSHLSWLGKGGVVPVWKRRAFILPGVGGGEDVGLSQKKTMWPQAAIKMDFERGGTADRIFS